MKPRLNRQFLDLIPSKKLQRMKKYTENLEISPRQTPRGEHVNKPMSLLVKPGRNAVDLNYYIF